MPDLSVGKNSSLTGANRTIKTTQIPDLEKFPIDKDTANSTTDKGNSVKSSDEGMLFRRPDDVGTGTDSQEDNSWEYKDVKGRNGTVVNHTATSHNNKVSEHTVDTDSSVSVGKGTANTATDKGSSVKSLDYGIRCYQYAKIRNLKANHNCTLRNLLRCRVTNRRQTPTKNGICHPDKHRQNH